MRNILLIDDDKKIVNYLCNDLEEKGFSVELIDDAEEALKKIENNNFHAIILDIMMPFPESWTNDEKTNSEIDLSTGLILLKKIRAVFPQIPILIYTARKGVSVVDQYTYTLAKPEFNIVIIEQLEKLISKSLTSREKNN